MKTITKDLLTAARFAYKSDTRPVLASVQITEKRIVATDSYKLLIVERDAPDAHEVADFPTVENVTPVQEIEKPILINAKDILKKLKMPEVKGLPVLSDAILGNETEDRVSITTTDLETSTTLQFKKVKGEFPDYERIMPGEKAVAEANFDAKLMIETLEAFLSEHGNNRVTLQFFGPYTPVIVKGEEKDTLNKTGLVMPLKI